jgi:hypothetical protein
VNGRSPSFDFTIRPLTSGSDDVESGRTGIKETGEVESADAVSNFDSACQQICTELFGFWGRPPDVNFQLFVKWRKTPFSIQLSTNLLPSLKVV